MARGLAQWPGEGGRQLCPLGRFELQVTGNPTQSGSNDKNFYYFMKKKKKKNLKFLEQSHEVIKDPVLSISLLFILSGLVLTAAGSPIVAR